MRFFAQRAVDDWRFWQNTADGILTHTDAGVRVTGETALSDDAILSAVSLLAGDIAGLPMRAYVTDGELTRPLDRQPPWIEAPDPIDQAITDVAHRTQVALSVLLKGNAYVRCEPNVFNPIRLEVLNPWLVRVVKLDGERLFKVMGRSDGDPLASRDVITTLNSAQVLHIPYLLRPGHLEGLSPIEAQAGNIGISLALRKWAETFFGKGAQVPGFVSLPPEASSNAIDDAEKRIRERWSGWRRAGILGVLGGGASYIKSGLSPQDADLGVLWRRQKEVVASVYGIPPFMIGSQEAAGQAYASVVDRRQEYKDHCLSRYTRPMEKAYSRLVPGDGRLATPGSNTEIRFVWDAFLRADPKARADMYHIALGDRWRIVDEIRALENLPPMSSFTQAQLDGPGGFLQTPNNTPQTPSATEQPPAIPNEDQKPMQPQRALNPAPSVTVEQPASETPTATVRGSSNELRAELAAARDENARLAAALAQREVFSPVKRSVRRDDRGRIIGVTEERDGQTIHKVVERDATGRILRVVEAAA